MEIKSKKIINKNKFTDKYYIELEYKYEYNGKFVKGCPNRVFSYDLTKCKCQLDKCLLFNNVP